MRELLCLRCQESMRFLMREKFQKGESGAWVGNLNFNFRGGFEMDIYSCKKCGRLEFFLPYSDDGSEMESTESFVQEDTEIVYVNAEGIPQVKCPACGKTHDFDYPQCPHCDYKQRI